jgi:O-Antigen ligase/PDZ domain
MAKLSHKVALLGLIIYVCFAPHSVAASTIGVAIATVGWLIRSITTRSLGVRRSKFDLIILLSLLWTVVTAFLSTEPAISIAKIQASWCVLLFYLTRAIIIRRTALMLVALLILSGCAGVLYSAYDLVRGRGVVVESVTSSSPLRKVDVNPGDTIWRLDGKRIYSLAELDADFKSAPVNKPLTVSLITNGEHVERPGMMLTSDVQKLSSPSGITGSSRSHRFRASGWTRHYETFSELLQMIAQLALGIALAHLCNHGPNKYFRLALLASIVLAVGIAFTAMRTVLVAFVIGASLIAWCTLRGIPKLVFTAALFLVIGFGAVVVWQTRAENALALGDPSSSLRVQVALVGLSRIKQHPVFGHGMDAIHLHWNEWGFPGKDMLHMHSTPLQIAFDRGLPMLALWLWLMVAFWISVARSAKVAGDRSDTNSYGILLGVLGALTGFLASSVVNYNYGDSEVAMMFWWLMGIAMAVQSELVSET